MSWTYQPDRLRKPAPSAIERDERRAGRETEYRKNSRLARIRDGNHCRVCGSAFGLESHHVVPRSLVGKALRDQVANLLTVCAEDHALFTRHVLKVEGQMDANLPLRILKFDKDEGGYVLYREAA